MSKKFDYRWEMIQEDPGEKYTLSRLKVFGGWIVSEVSLYTGHQTLSNVFVPDPKHEWKI